MWKKCGRKVVRAGNTNFGSASCTKSRNEGLSVRLRGNWSHAIENSSAFTMRLCFKSFGLKCSRFSALKNECIVTCCPIFFSGVLRFFSEQRTLFSSTYSQYLLGLHLFRCVIRFDDAWLDALILDPQERH